MTALLLFQLRAPMAAFGSVAPGERRETLESPGHAALAGCLAAALGLERTDPRVVPFTQSLAFAVRTDQLGPPVADYHTAQVPAARRNLTWATRRAELQGDVNTILSRRDYRFGCAYTIVAMIRPLEAITADLAPLIDLSHLAEALKVPQFTLYLGRKSCPLGAPPLPRLLEAQRSLYAALAAYDEIRAFDPCDFRTDVELGILADEAFVTAGLLDPDAIARRVERRDALVSRDNWRFDRRSVPIFPVRRPAPEPASGERPQ